MVNVLTLPKKRLKDVFSRARSLTTRPIKLWDNLDIPAKLFYQISENEDYNLLIISGNPTKKQINKAWYKIIDEVWKVSKNGRQRNIQHKRIHIALLSHKITVITAILKVLYIVVWKPKQQKQLIDKLSKLGIKINKVAPGKFKDEVHKVLQRDIGGLNTKLAIQQDMLKEMLKPYDKKVAYTRAFAKLSRAVQLKLDINMTLDEFLGWEVEAIEMSNAVKAEKNG